MFVTRTIALIMIATGILSPGCLREEHRSWIAVDRTQGTPDVEVFRRELTSVPFFEEALDLAKANGRARITSESEIEKTWQFLYQKIGRQEPEIKVGFEGGVYAVAGVAT